MNWLHGLLLLLLLSTSSSATGPSRVKKDRTTPTIVSQNSISILDADCLIHIAKFLRPFEKKSAELACKHFKGLSTEKEREGLKPDIEATNKELALLFRREEEEYGAPPMFGFRKAWRNNANQKKNLKQLTDNLCELADPKVVKVAIQKSIEELEREMENESDFMDELIPELMEEQDFRRYVEYGERIVEHLESHLREHVADPTRIKGAVKDAWKEKSALERAVDDDLDHAVLFILGFNRYYRPGQYAKIFEIFVEKLYRRPFSEHKVLTFLLEDERALALLENALSKVPRVHERSDNAMELFVRNLNEMLGKSLHPVHITLRSNHAEPPSFTLAIERQSRVY